MQGSSTQDRQTLGACLMAAGFVLAAAAASAALAAAGHMAGAAELCGPAVRHCGLCVASAASLAASLAASTAGVMLLRPIPSLQRARRGPRP